MHWKRLPLQYEWVEEQPSLLGKAGALAVEVSKKIKSTPSIQALSVPGLSCPAIRVRAGSFLCPFSLQILSPQGLPPPNTALD